MKKLQTFKLIDGEFSSPEARNILFALINSKINFHSTESFGITVRTSGDTSFHDRRIKELAQTGKDILKLIDYATENNLRLKIHSLIEIQLVNEPR